MKPPLRFAKTVDGGNVAYVDVGQGYPVVTFFVEEYSNLAADWDVPLFASWHEAFARRLRYIRFEPRGMTNSDPAPEGRSTLDYLEDDLNAVADAAGLSAFAVLSQGQFAEFGVRYAARHAQSVTHLALVDAVTRDIPEWTSLERVRRGVETREIRAVATGIDLALLDARMRLGESADDTSVERVARNVRNNRSEKWKACWFRILDMWHDVDLKPYYPQVRQPVIVLSQAPFYDGMAREIAASIPGSLLSLGVFQLTHHTESRANGQPTPATELARFVYGVQVAPDRPPSSAILATLTGRELEILALIAAGHSNVEIGEALVLSAATISRHVANIYGKLGIHNRAQATAVYFGHASEGPTAKST